MPIKIEYSKCCWKDGKCKSCSCKGSCQGCAEVCPTKAITRAKVVKINKEKCIECGVCIKACPFKALSLN